MDMHYYKICVVGETNVGKSSLIYRYIHNNFNTDTPCTIGASFFGKQLTHKNRNINLQIWDTAGQERYRTLGPLYYRDANAVIVVIDSTSKQIQEEVTYWIQTIRTHNERAFIFIAYSKYDLVEESKEVYTEELCKHHDKIIAYSVSAKENINIQDLFQKIIESIHDTPNLIIPNKNTIELNVKPKPWWNPCYK